MENMLMDVPPVPWNGRKRAGPLSEFSRDHAPLRPAPSSRAMAGALTAALYTLFALLIWWSFTHAPIAPATREITATLLPDVPEKRALEPLPPILAHLIKPHAETAALPVYTIASGAPLERPAPLPASAAKSSPMPGGTSGTGPMGQAASGNGTGGNGGGLAGCVDPAWMRAVTQRVLQFFYYPGAALAQHTTGVVTLHFIVRRDGQVDRLEIGKSSGDAGLDRAATDIMHRALPLPPFPDRMHVDRVDGHLAINFGVRGLNDRPSAGSCS